MLSPGKTGRKLGKAALSLKARTSLKYMCGVRVRGRGRLGDAERAEPGASLQDGLAPLRHRNHLCYLLFQGIKFILLLLLHDS